MASLIFNKNVKLIISDVDETIADLYVDASSEMILELEKLLMGERVLFLVSGQSVQNIQKRIVNYIRKDLRKRIIVGHCSGAEVWGFREDGKLRGAPFYSLYDTTLSEAQKRKWRDLTHQLIEQFKLRVYPTMPIPEFQKRSNRDPLSIMLEDRGPQITFEVVNGYDLSPEQVKELDIEIPYTHGYYDLRIPILELAEKLMEGNNLPITPRLAGEFAIDFAIRGVSKTTAVKYVIENESVLISLGLHGSDIKIPESIEVWGDKFSITRGGTDRHISEALPKEVRSITFREENHSEFSEGYNIVVWNGKKHLQEGLLEYLKFRA